MTTHYAEIEVALAEISSLITNNNHKIDTAKGTLSTARSELQQIPTKFSAQIAELDALLTANPNDDGLKAAKARMTRLLATANEKWQRADTLVRATAEGA